MWDAIDRDPQGVPSCEEVSLPHPPGSSSVDHHVDVTQSPLSHHERAFSVMRCKIYIFTWTTLVKDYIAFCDNPKNGADVKKSWSYFIGP